MIDWILGGIILFFSILGVYRGFVREVFGFLSLLFGIYFAFNFMGSLSGLLLNLFPDFPGWLLPPLSFILIFIGVVFLGRLLGRWLSKILSWAMLGWLNRLAGALIGLFKGLILASLLAIVLGFFSTQMDSLKEGIDDSFLYPVVLNIAPFTYDVITAILPAGKKTVEELKDKIPDFEIPGALDNLKYLQDLNILSGSDADSSK